MLGTAIIGFDSAWTDNPKAPGAVSVIAIDETGAKTFVAPRLATFGQALEVIAGEQTRHERVFVAIDQPTIVPNLGGARPVDRVAASLMSWLGGGVQPANRSRTGMFDADAPIWAFKAALGASDNPELARDGVAGTYIAEVFPAMSLPSMALEFCGRRMGPRYNPGRKATFKIDDWQAVLVCAAACGDALGIDGVADWCAVHAQKPWPSKADQDLLDGLLCALIGYLWLFEPRSRLLMIGDLIEGYMVAPAIGEARARLEAAALLRSVPCR
ncbi:hypothetical protein VW35_15440 [Devosia soli]|uniref:DUF429 domain-containing protein n=1 Tax=Devosia soli TaxID=361041 RepID=A0A0F5L685_9HYPH|nr:DUF429 domain-containing protein [Devosia soli]KKB77122.1 hypothetical protein VW35_15440 [Devosia soli]